MIFQESRLQRLSGNKKMKLNIGSGEKKLSGFVNIDKYPSQKGDLKGDLEKKINLASGCAEEIMLDNVIEHVDSIPNTMKEIRRLLKKWCSTYLHASLYKSFILARSYTQTSFILFFI